MNRPVRSGADLRDPQSLDAWLDTNGNGARDRGDLGGRVGPLTLRDRGLVRGNFTRAPDLVLTPR